MAAASTGIASRSRIAVRNTDHTNSGQFIGVIEGGLILMQVVMKLIAPRMDEAPAR